MYEARELGAIKIPDWIKKAAGAVIRGTTVTVPTVAGPIAIDLGNKASVDAAKAAIMGAKVSTTVGEKPESPLDRVASAVESVPGGWLTVAGVGALALYLIAGRSRR